MFFDSISAFKTLFTLFFSVECSIFVQKGWYNSSVSTGMFLKDYFFVCYCIILHNHYHHCSQTSNLSNFIRWKNLLPCGRILIHQQPRGSLVRSDVRDWCQVFLCSLKLYLYICLVMSSGGAIWFNILRQVHDYREFNSSSPLFLEVTV